MATQLVKQRRTQMATQLVKQTNAALALSGGELDEMFGESKLDTSTNLSFNVVKIMRESAQFELAPDDYAKKMVGHILFKHNANQWWEIPYDERGEDDSPVPDCYSIDGITPSGGDKMQSQFCATCPKNKFGSGKDGNGKACRNSMRFLFLPEGAVLPIIIIAPPTSLSKKGSVQRWLNDVPNKVAQAYTALGLKTKAGGPIVDYWTAKVELSLEKEKFGSGLEASVLFIKTLDVLTPDNPDNANKLKQLFGMVRDTQQAYKAEMHAYLETEPETLATETVAAEIDNGSDDIPI